jgi:hypothetical protein
VIGREGCGCAVDALALEPWLRLQSLCIWPRSVALARATYLYVSFLVVEEVLVSWLPCGRPMAPSTQGVSRASLLGR